MFRSVCLFEIKYRLHRVSTWVYVAIWFLVPLALMSVTRAGGPAGGRLYYNSPYTIQGFMSGMMLFGVLVISGIFGSSIVRDFEERTYEMIFTKPITKGAYLGGRLVGSAVVALAVFAVMVPAFLLAPLMPWANRESYMSVHLWYYVQPYLSIVATEVLSLGAIFFMVGALTRNIVAVYLQGIVFLALYLIAGQFVSDLPNSLSAYISGLIDPLAMRTTTIVARYWTVSEKNSQVAAFSGLIAYNRLLWLALGAIATAATFRFFPFSVEALVAGRRVGRAAEADAPGASVAVVAEMPRPLQVFRRWTTAAQFWRMTRLRVALVLTGLPFLALLVTLVADLLVFGVRAGRLGDAPVWPVTYLMVQMMAELGGGAAMILVIVATIYAGELAWRERDLGFDQIQDTLPAPTWLAVTSQLAALMVVFTVLSVLIIAVGVGIQAFLGYYHFELLLYVKGILVLNLLFCAQYTAAALFLQHVVRNKFLAHTLLVGSFVLLQVASSFGFVDVLYRFGEKPWFRYSDMNGYGHFVAPLAWFNAYWLACASLMLVVAIAATKRGTESGWGARLRDLGALGRRPLGPMAGLAAVIFAAVGAFIFYNTHILNRFDTARRLEDRQVRYERQYKRYESLPQPKIASVDLTVSLFPERRAFSATGRYVLVNRTAQRVSDILVFDPVYTLQRVSFDRPFTTSVADKEQRFYVYRLATPLDPGASTRLDFTVGYEVKGFLNRDDRPELVYNGTFLGREYFPWIGYSGAGELLDEDARRRRGLTPRPPLPPPDDAAAAYTKAIARDADWITFKTTVSTSADQVVVAPGYLQREWVSGPRRYFQYDMSHAPVHDFYAMVSGRYTVRRDRWQGTAIEVYYHPQHPYNVDRMIEAVKKGLAYYAAAFGPYPFRQFRVVEFPRYGNYAQAFPGMVPYSEGIGFIAHATAEDDLDMPFYVTLHELAHQWWAHQVVGSLTQGSNLMAETLAQYSALMVMEKEVGPSNLRMYLRHELDRYLSGRSGDAHGERPLFKTGAAYALYNKGTIAMYALKDAVGEAAVNAALRRYLEATRFQNPPYTNSLEFLAYLKAAVPESRRGLVEDLFERIILYDNRALDATCVEKPGGRFAVSLKVSVRKLQADDVGREQPLIVNDLIDIGVFAGSGLRQRPLYLEKRRLTQGETTCEIEVGERPTSAGIDPYNKLVDRRSDDNTITVTKR